MDVPSPRRPNAFTLVELLVVIAIIGVLMAILIPAFNGIRGDIPKATYDIAGTLEQARTYAMANNTYVWVGFYEEDGSQSSTAQATSGVGRVVMSIVTSKDGTRYSDASINVTDPPAFGTELSTASPLRNQVQLVQLNKIMKLNNIHLVAVNDPTTASNNLPARPGVAVEYQMGEPAGQAPDNKTGLFAKHTTPSGGGSVTNPTFFTYPLAKVGTTQTYQYTFVKIIEFNPQGEASKIVENTYSGTGAQNLLEIALQPTHGSALDSRYSGTNKSKAAVAIQVDGLTGRVGVFRL
jgi:prepilin-type N-terminal cleavage/methylation domain-containing protein